MVQSTSRLPKLIVMQVLLLFEVTKLFIILYWSWPFFLLFCILRKILLHYLLLKSHFGRGLLLASMGRRGAGVLGKVGIVISFGLWKAIKSGWDVSSSRTSYNVGNGWRVMFWNDIWCGDSTLKRIFSLIIFHILDKGSLGGGCLGPPWRRRDLESCFSRNLNDWELERVQEFLSRL